MYIKRIVISETTYYDPNQTPEVVIFQVKRHPTDAEVDEIKTIIRDVYRECGASFADIQSRVLSYLSSQKLLLGDSDFIEFDDYVIKT